jgi:hypothetical protein
MKNSTLHMRIDAKLKKAAALQADARGVTLTVVVERFLALYGQGDIDHDALMQVRPGRLYRQLLGYWRDHPEEQGQAFRVVNTKR